MRQQLVPAFLPAADCLALCQRYDAAAPTATMRGYSGEPVVYPAPHPLVVDQVAKLINKQIETVTLNCLSLGQSHPWHTDNGRPEIVQRIGTAMLYLNEDFTGGELQVEGEPLVKPTTGLLTVFAASMRHQVLPVTSGKRYSLAMWFTHPFPPRS